MKKNTLSIINMPILLFNLYISSTFGTLILNSPIIDILMYASGIGLFIVMSLKISKYHIHLYIIMFLLILVFFLNIAFFSSTLNGIAHIVKIFPAVGGAIFLLNGYLNKYNALILLLLPTIYFIVSILVGIDPNQVFHSTSRNMISVVMLFFTALYYISLNTIEKPPIIPAFMLVLISIWATGRSGVFASIILLLGIVYIRYSKSILNKIFIFCLLISSSVYLLNNNSLILNFFTEYRFEPDLLLKDPRFEIWDNYFKNVSFGNFLLGSDWRDNILYFSGSGNVHNSYINSIIRFGFSSIVIFAYILLGLIIAFKRNILFFILIISILIRSVTDTIILFGMFDFILFFLVSKVIIDKKLSH
ncbi:hypothetical protein [Jeotgalibacillus malaysiensis]|uniref:hypothetical protein n=1 Tax=Jeotgalibacillus malaysiensis TaxID=1508404 RepID=UPI003850A03A